MHRLTCSSAGGNPPATLKWYKDDTEVTGATNEANRGVAESHLDILLEASDNEAVYRCEASNLATETPLSNSTMLKVQCVYLISINLQSFLDSFQYSVYR